jgi:hypothetical protein
MSVHSGNYTYSAGDILVISNSLRAVLDAVLLMRPTVDDRSMASFDSLIVDKLTYAIALLKQVPAKPQQYTKVMKMHPDIINHRDEPRRAYTSEEIEAAIFEEILNEAEQKAEEKVSKRSRKGKSIHV